MGITSLCRELHDSLELDREAAALLLPEEDLATAGCDADGVEREASVHWDVPPNWVALSW